MKRMKLVILTAALSLMMGVEALAAGSSAGNVQVSQTPKEASVVKSDGTVSTELVVPVLSAGSELLDQGNARLLVGAGHECAVYSMEVSLTLASTGEAVELNGPLTLDFAVPYVTPNTVVKVRHWKHDWTVEDLEPTVGDGRISVTFTSLSPVAIVVDNTTDSNPDNDESTLSSSGSSSSSTPAATGSSGAAAATGRSPKTGETSVIYGVGGIAVLAALGMVACKKKAHS